MYAITWNKIEELNLSLDHKIEWSNQMWINSSCSEFIYKEYFEILKNNGKPKLAKLSNVTVFSWNPSMISFPSPARY